VAGLRRDALQRLAQLGARARLEELRREMDAIRRAFPDLVGRRSGGARSARPTRRRRKRAAMSAAGRRAVSARMKKYWAARRKAKGAK
jgi:hypothetical protein